MTIRAKILILLALYLVSNSLSGLPEIQPSNKNPAIVEGSWDTSVLGNHRAVVRVTQKADAVRVRIPWRRRDSNPEKKKVVVVDAASGHPVDNVYPVHIDRELGDLVFQPKSVPGVYYFYFMPYKKSGQRYHPEVKYLKPERTAEIEWLERNELNLKNEIPVIESHFPDAEFVEIQSIEAFNSFWPMEMIATESELKELLAQNAHREYLLFPESREHPIRMTDHLPLKWIKSGPQKTFSGEAARGEFYVFQVGLFAVAKTIKNLRLEFSELSGPGFKIPSTAFTCFNTSGKDRYSVDKGKVGALWCGVQIPKDANPGRYVGKISINSEESEKKHVIIHLEVNDEVIGDKGDSEPWRHSHLRWLDSKIGQDNKTVEPFPPLQVEDKTVKCLGRSVTLDVYGFPKNIRSFFAPDMIRLSAQARELLASPLKLVIETSENGRVSWKNKSFRFIGIEEDAASWESQNRANCMRIICRGKMEFDGFIDYGVVIIAEEDVDLEDIRLGIPLSKDAARYLMGMGLKGGLRPSENEWKWDPGEEQNSAWIGDINAGIQFKLKKNGPSTSQLPSSWYNEGKGGCIFREADEDAFLIEAFTGPKTLKSGEELNLCFHLLITPFKTVDLRSHWNTRFVNRMMRSVLASRIMANVISLPQSSRLTPYINYPFLGTERLEKYVERAHSKDLRVVIELSGNQLSNHAPEIFALKSPGIAVFQDGPGGGASWLQEHLVSRYSPGLYVPIHKDAAIQTSAHSRWYNFYLESIDWTMKKRRIDGLFLDDPLFGRQTMKRLRKVLDQNHDNAVIDLHASNKWTKHSGFASSANRYLELFPYVDRIWFGKSYTYDEPPDYWLIEVSGIPFGLTGDICQVGTNSWHGMLYGMTPRHSAGAGNPREFWRIWDQFGIQDARMYGYWMPDCPVKSHHTDVPATVYVKKDKAMIVLASWADRTVSLKLDYDWDALGMNPENTELYIPPMDYLQDEFTFAHPYDSISVRAKRGWLLYLRKKVP